SYLLIDSSPIVGVMSGKDLHLLDASRPIASFLSTKLLTVQDKLKLIGKSLYLLKPLIGLNPYDLRNRIQYDTVSMETYLNKVFGKKLNDAILAAVARGVTLSTPKEASVIEFFAGAVAASGKMQNLKGGMGILPQTLAKNLDIQLNSIVQSVTKK